MEIIKRRKYYYLKHSYREKGKVITKEKYLGKKIPKNISQIGKEFLKKTKKELYSKLDKIKKNFRKEWKEYPKSIKDNMLTEFSIDFTYNTNAIEGSTITREETEDLIKRKIAPNKKLRDIQETINHSKVFLEMLKEKQNLTSNLLLKWHKEIFSESKEDIAGKFRTYNVGIGGYMCPSWRDIKPLMKEFFKWYKKADEHPVELAGMAHYKFVMVHPFGDGNGRITRLITNFILHKNKFPLIFIEYKNRRSYYRAIQKGEYEFVKYFVKRYLSNYKKYLKSY